MPREGEDWTPDFPGQRAPFEPGNTAAVTHGARSSRRVDPLAAERLAELLDDPHTPEYLVTDPSFRPALAALARAEAVVALLAEFVAGQGLTDEVVSPRGALETLRRWEQTAAGHRRALGLDPSSRARLTKDLSGAAYMQGLTGTHPLTAALDRLDAERRELGTGADGG